MDRYLYASGYAAAQSLGTVAIVFVAYCIWGYGRRLFVAIRRALRHG